MVKVKIPEWIAKANRLPQEFECTILKDASRAFQVEVGSKILWLPKGKTTIVGDYTMGGRTPKYLLTVGDARIFLKVPYNEKDKVQAIMGATWSKKYNIWIFPRNVQIVALAKIAFGDDLEVTGVEDLIEETNHIKIRDLYPFQEVGANFLAYTGHLLTDEMGLGKTIQAIAACRILDVQKVLVICPNSLKRNWAREIEKWDPGKEVVVVSGSKAERYQALTMSATYTIINPEVLRLHANMVLAKGSQKIVKAVLAPELVQPWNLIIIDEAHKLKNRHAQVTHVVRALRKCTKRVFELTGTPIMNRASDLWALLNILEPSQYRSFWKFAEAFCNVYEDWGYVVEDITDPNDPKVIALRNHLTSIMLRRTKLEVLMDMPEKTIQKVWIPLEGEQEKIYHKMARTMFATMDGNTVTADIPLTKVMRLKQICIDPNLVFSPQEISPLEGVKAEALLETIGGLAGGKVVIFSQFSNAIYRVAKLLNQVGITYTVLTGDTKEKDRQVAIDFFQTSPDCQVFLTTIQAGGMGITLTAASTAIFLDKMWTPAVNTQAQDRLHRIGQTEPVTIIELLVEGSVEEAIEALLDYKQKVIDIAVDGKDAPIGTINLHELIQRIREMEGTG